MKKRTLFLLLPLVVVLVGCLIVGFAYQRAYRQARLDRTLVMAVQGGDLLAVHSLLKGGADANAKDRAAPDLHLLTFVKHLFTHWQVKPAQESMHPYVLQVLLAQAADRRSFDPDKRILNYDAIGEALIRHGAKARFHIDGYGSALGCAATVGMHRTVQSLLVCGEDANSIDADGYSPIMGADAVSTALLLRFGAHPNACTARGITALHMAAEGYEPGAEVVRLLLAAGANPNARDANGITPLMLAGMPESARLLLRYGADVNARDKHGANVLSYAEGNYKIFSPEEHKLFLEILKRHGAKR